MFGQGGFNGFGHFGLTGAVLVIRVGLGKRAIPAKNRLSP